MTTEEKQILIELIYERITTGDVTGVFESLDFADRSEDERDTYFETFHKYANLVENIASSDTVIEAIFNAIGQEIQIEAAREQ